jgi:dihydroorotase
MTHSRRYLVKAAASLAALGALPTTALAAMGPNDKFDLLLRNANVLDPSQGLSGKRDIGIR